PNAPVVHPDLPRHARARLGVSHRLHELLPGVRLLILGLRTPVEADTAVCDRSRSACPVGSHGPTDSLGLDVRLPGLCLGCETDPPACPADPDGCIRGRADYHPAFPDRALP